MSWSAIILRLAIAILDLISPEQAAVAVFVEPKYLKLNLLKGYGMGPWLVLDSPCFRENVVATCKIGSFCFFFFEIKFQNGAHLKRRTIFDLLFTFFSHQGKLQKILQHLSHSHTYTYFAYPWLFCLTNYEKNTNLSGTLSLWYESWCWFFAPVWNNQGKCFVLFCCVTENT